MKYQCGHSACDLCGRHRRCDPSAGHLSTIANLLVCNGCLSRAVTFTHEVACKFGGTVIDVTKPCARPLSKEKAIPAYRATNETSSNEYNHEDVRDRENEEDVRAAAIEATWKERQGEDYGSY